MILPHDGDKGNIPKDAKLFGAFVLVVVLGIVGFLLYN